MRMKDRVALVTGAGGPMGMAVAKRFAEEGASLVITDISATRLAEGERVAAAEWGFGVVLRVIPGPASRRGKNYRTGKKCARNNVTRPQR